MIPRWYLSFVADEEWLGACVVDAASMSEAFFTATLLGLNPGGQVLIVPVPEELRDELPIERLLIRDEIPGAVRAVDVLDLLPDSGGIVEP